MEYYFEVIFTPEIHVLVKETDVIKAGFKAEKVLSERGVLMNEARVIEVIRTKIIEVIE